MGLIARWLLDGDLLDSSGNGNHLQYMSNNGVLTSVTEGIVVQKSYKAASINFYDYFRSLKPINLSGSFTMSCWCKVNALANINSGSANGILTNHDHTANSGGGITLKAISSSDCRLSCNTGNGTSRTYNTIYGNTNIFGSWNLLTLSYNGEKIKLYVNGLKDSEAVYSMYCKDDFLDLFGWSTAYESQPVYRPAINLQDVRIYDHCLSDKEIYDLSKAKVLHYTFDDVEEPTVNLFPVNNKLMPIRSGTDSSWELYNDSDNNIVYKFNRVNQTLYEYNGFDTVVAIGDKYTLSMDIYISTDYDRNSGILVRFENAISTTFELDNTKKGIWQRCMITDTCTTTTLRTLLYPSPNSSAGTKGYILYRNPQLEKKNQTTPFVNGTRDNIVVRDKSDYGNDSLPLTVSNTPAFLDTISVGNKDENEINRQLGLLKKFCSARGYTVNAFYIDSGCSSNSSNRKEYNNMLERIKTNKISKVITYRNDSISRNNFDFTKAYFSEHGCEIISIDDSISRDVDKVDFCKDLELFLKSYDNLYSKQRIKDICEILNI